MAFQVCYDPQSDGTGGLGVTTERMRIKSNGNVGIGTSSPQTPLHVISAEGGPGSGNAAYGLLVTAGPGNRAVNIGTNGTAGWIQSAYTNNIGIGNILALNPNGGNVGIGTTSPGYPLEVSGTAYMSGTVYVGTTNTDPTLGRVNGINLRSDGRIFSRDPGGGHSFGMASTSGTAIQFWTDNGSTRVAAGAITSSGSSTSYTSSSDYRLKDNIAPITGALNIISSLNPVTYTWKSDGSPGHGFIAHELQEVVPDAVVGEKDAVDSDGNIKPQGIDKSYLVSYLTAATQELSAKNTVLEQSLASATARLDSLESRLAAAGI
jgi:hypothetical protein